MKKFNTQTIRFLDQFKKDLLVDTTNPDAIQGYFDKYLELLGQEKRKVILYTNNLEGWTAARESAWDIDRNINEEVPMDFTGYKLWETIMNLTPSWEIAEEPTENITMDAAGYATRAAARSAIRGAAEYAVCLNLCDKDDDCDICISRKPNYQLYLAFKAGVFTYWIMRDKVIVILRS